ncbi:MAG: amidase [Saprospiraceae bacterium]|nr:amidase [Saprospiraceae bacterium]
MKRRNFLRNTALGGITIPLIASGCTNTPETKASSGAQNNEVSSQKDSFKLLEATVADLQKMMEDGSLSARQITELYLDRIRSIDQKGPALNSVIEINPEALSIAEQLDKERKAGKIRGPLHGIPILIKDNIDTGDNMQTTAGALVMVGNQPQTDAFIVTKMRNAGAILLGKTNLSEWANFRSTRSSSGWSGRGGQTKNPYVLDRNPCGSSSGSGASVSANLCAIAIGTETNGSIVCPSNANGVVGIKPTVGLWSRSGIIPISFTQDTAGPMARTVRDAVILLGPLTGVDTNDAKTVQSTGKSFPDYTPYLDKNGLTGTRIGIIRDMMGFHEGVDIALEDAFEAMRQKGAEIIDVEFPEEWQGLGGAGYNVLLYEFKDGVNKYLQTANPSSGVKTLEDIIAWNIENESEAMPYFKQEILKAAHAKGDLNTQEYLEALEKTVNQSRKGIERLLREHNLDALAGPTGGPAWTTDVINGDKFGGGSSSPAARAGYPNITVPAGLVAGLPFGISFFAEAFAEPRLIKIAYAFEQATKQRVAPAFKDKL